MARNSAFFILNFDQMIGHVYGWNKHTTKLSTYDCDQRAAINSPDI